MTTMKFNGRVRSLVVNDFKCPLYLLGCCSAYHAMAHPDMANINTQRAEQSNSLLNRLRGMLSYMSQENFVRHVSMFLGYRNMLRRLHYINPDCAEESVALRHFQCCRR